MRPYTHVVQTQRLGLYLLLMLMAVSGFADTLNSSAEIMRIYNTDKPGQRLTLYQNDSLSVTKPGGVAHGEYIRVLEKKSMESDHGTIHAVRIHFGKREGWIDSKFVMDKEQYHAHPVPYAYYALRWLAIALIFLSVLGGLAGFIGVILRLLRSGEYVSHNTHALMAWLWLGGFGVMVLGIWLVLGTALKNYLT